MNLTVALLAAGITSSLLLANSVAQKATNCQCLFP